MKKYSGEFKGSNKESISLHQENNAFIKSQGAKVAKRQGKVPMLNEESRNMDAYMCNDGKNAEETTHKLTAGLDKDAFPVM